MDSYNETLPPLVIDKSFAHAVKAERLRELAKKWTLVVPTAFYYEIFTTEAHKRQATLKGFTTFRRFHPPSFLKLERETGSPVTSAECPPLQFAEYLLDENWQQTAEVHQVNTSYLEGWINPNITFWREVLKHRHIPGFTSDEIIGLRGKDNPLGRLCERLINHDFIRFIAAQLEVPFAELLTEEWFTFRQIQCMIMHGLALLGAYPHDGVGPNQEDMEHDLLDLDYLMLGLHCRALATKESLVHPRRMGWRFKKLSPEGQCITA